MTHIARRATGLSLACFAFLLPVAAHAQSREDALRDFDFVLETMRRNYAQFPDKTAGGKAAEFHALVRVKRAQLE